MITQQVIAIKSTTSILSWSCISLGVCELEHPSSSYFLGDSYGAVPQGVFVIIPLLADRGSWWLFHRQFAMQLINGDPQPFQSPRPSKHGDEVSSLLMTSLVATMIIFLTDPKWMTPGRPLIGPCFAAPCVDSEATARLCWGVMVGLVALSRGWTGLTAACKIGPYLSSSSATLKRPAPAQTNMLCSFDQLRMLRVFEQYSVDRLVQGVFSQLSCACQERGPLHVFVCIERRHLILPQMWQQITSNQCRLWSHLNYSVRRKAWQIQGYQRNIRKWYKVQVQSKNTAITVLTLIDGPRTIFHYRYSSGNSD